MARHGTPRYGLLMAFLGLLAASCHSPELETPKAGRDGVPVEAPVSSLVFDPPELHLGRVVPGGFIDGEARVRNASDRPIELVNYSAPCECTSAEPELPRTLRPGESFSFPVRLDLGQLPRGGLSLNGGDPPELVRRTLILWTADGRATELPVVVELSEQLDVRPTVSDLRRVVRGETKTTTVVLGPGRNRPERAIEILDIELVPGPVPLRVEQRPSGLGVELDLVLGPVQEAGRLETEVRVLTDAEPEQVRLLLVAEVVEPLLIVPAAIHLPAADPTRPVVLKVHVRRRDGGPIALKSYSTRSGRIKLSPLGESPNGAQMLRVLIAVPPWPAEVRGEVLLETDFPGEAGRLTVPVFVQARPPR